ncbi:MAG: DUF2203 domain-containing protein [Chloroflexi bacterium]|nr:DUF2203 domain-containing protein [Chloroflexota bacterium]
MKERVFTVDEANALLPSLRDLLERMRRQAAEMQKVRSALNAVRPRARANGHAPRAEELAGRLYELEHELQEADQRLSDWGVLLRDLESGLVDFPANRQGQSIFLCWRLSEDRVGFWHDRQSGFDARQPLTSDE